MARCKCLIPLLLTLVFAAMLTAESGRKDYINSVLTDLGLSLSCVNQVLATCHDSPAEIQTDGVKMVEKVADTKTDRESFGKMNCADLRKGGDGVSGVRTVYPFTCCKNRAVTVFCDQETDGGGWTVLQRRDVLHVRDNFFREWSDYRKGFGDLNGEFWLGLDNIHALVSATPNELHVYLEDFEGNETWAKYDTFSIEDEEGKYRLKVAGYSGSAGDSMHYQDGMMFTTRDQDNDKEHSQNCAEDRRGAWWYKNCHWSNLNGFQYEGKHGSYGDGINWRSFRGDFYSLKKTEMKVRPKVKN